MNKRFFVRPAVFALGAMAAFSQPAQQATPGPNPAASSAAKPAPKPDKASAYYNYAMGHLYAELAAAYGNRGEYLNQAIEHYRNAVKADPKATFLSEELAELYVSAGQIRTAVTEAEEALKQNPDDLGSRRLLGRLYARMIGDSQTNRVNETMLKKSIEQYEKIAQAAPKDTDTWLMLARLYKVAQNSPEAEKAYKKALELEPENEEGLIGLATVYADLGDNKTSTELLERVARKSPSLRTLTALASSYESMREYKLASETLRRAVEISPNNPELKRFFAQDLMLSDQLDEAIKVYEEMIEDDPKDAQSMLRLSQIYRQQRHFDKSRALLAKAKEVDPNNLELRYNEVSLLEAEGKTAQAIEVLRGVLDAGGRRNNAAQDKANRVVLLERLGLLYRQNEQPAEAVAAFRQMMEADPETGARATAQIIETYRGARDYKKAVEEADAAKTKYPNDRMIKLVRANLLAENGRADEAVRDVRTLLDGKSDREVYLSLAQIYEKAKNYQEMAKAIDDAEKLSGGEEKENLIFMRGAMFEKMKDFDAAEREFRKVLSADPQNASALNYLGYMLADRNVRLTEAHDMIKKAVDQEPTNGAFLDSLGWVLYRMDRMDEAETMLLKAAERAPRDPTVHDHLGDVYFKQGKLKDAIGQWDRSLVEWKSSAPSEADPVEVAKIQKKFDSVWVRQVKESGSQAK